VKLVRWQGITESAASSGVCRPITRGATVVRQRHARVAGAPKMVVREPEASWWETQEQLDEPAVDSGGATVTVAAVREWDAGRDPFDVTSRLAQLAVQDELLVVFGAGPGDLPGHHAVVAGLRMCLPRHDVVTLEARDRRAGLAQVAALLARFLDAGRLPVLVTEADALHDVTAEVASHLRADRVLRVFSTPEGADLYQVWQRHSRSGVN